MTTAGDTFRALADLFDQPEVLARASLDVVRKQEERIDRMDKRMEQLEALCRDLWLFACITGSGGAEKAFEHRMNALGLLEGEQND